MNMNSSSCESTCFDKEKKMKKKPQQKKKASVKLSTDPQSVAARQRRHRISDRFKTLQSLVPGGSKMDTVSMLEEAIHYVKFLKTQIWLHENIINNIVVDNNNNDYHPNRDELFMVPANPCFDHNYNNAAGFGAQVIKGIDHHVQQDLPTDPLSCIGGQENMPFIEEMQYYY